MSIQDRDWDVMDERAERIKEWCDDEKLTDEEATLEAYRAIGPYMKGAGK